MGQPAVVVPVGAVGRAVGIKGWFRVRSDMDPPDELLRHDVWQVERAGEWRPMAVEGARPHGKGFVAQLVGVKDRDAAAAFTGARLGLPRDAFPDPDDGQYYWADLIGLEVVDEAGEPLGAVRNMVETGANDVMVIAPAAAGAPERMVPFVLGEVVRRVDVAGGRIEVAWRF